MDDHNAESQMSRQVKRQWLRRMAKVGRRTEIKPPFLRRPRNLLPLQALAFSDDDLRSPGSPSRSVLPSNPSLVVDEGYLFSSSAQPPPPEDEHSSCYKE